MDMAKLCMNELFFLGFPALNSLPSLFVVEEFVSVKKALFLLESLLLSGKFGGAHRNFPITSQELTIAWLLGEEVEGASDAHVGHEAPERGCERLGGLVDKLEGAQRGWRAKRDRLFA